MDPTTLAAPTPVPARSRRASAGLALAGLLVLSDLLLWQVEPGINLALVFLGLGLAILALHPGAWGERVVQASAAIYVLGLAPLVEAPSLTGVAVALAAAGLLALAASGALPRRFETMGGALIGFGLFAPFRLMGDGLGLLLRHEANPVRRNIWRPLLGWLVPLGLAGAFLLLFASANPLIEAALAAIRLDGAGAVLDPFRIAFWLLLAVLAWPVLRPLLPGWLAWPAGPVEPARAEGVVFGRDAILRSLVVFNGLFAVQTGLDALYLWGGVTLPEGMSYADYAHRGAYPLVVTALLAAGFVLVAMRPGGAAMQSRLIRGLVYLFLAQNVGLVLSSILRLDLYVEVYALTGLRLAAGIWMGLVAVGLVLILLRIVLGRSNGWLVTSNLAALWLVLWGTSLFDLNAVIARFNVEHSREVGGAGQPLDYYHFAELGPSALPALEDFLDRAEGRSEPSLRDFHLLAREWTSQVEAGPTDWRSWSLRGQRLRDVVGGQPGLAEAASGAMDGLNSR